MSSTDSTSVFGQRINLNTTITGGSGTPTGTIDVLDGGVPICNALPLQEFSPGFAGRACSTAALAVGNHQITSSYSGDGTYAPEVSTTFAAATSQDVAAAATTTIVASNDTTVFSAPSTFTATIAVTSPGAGDPTGTVEFKDGATDITGCETRAVASRAATCSSPATGIGSRTITAIYSGDGSFNGSTDTFAQTMDQADTTTVVTSDDPAPSLNAPITYTATISPVSPATAIPAGGTVSFSVDDTPIVGCETQLVGPGTASCSTTANPNGSPSITAAYTGDGDFNPSTSVGLDQSVASGSSTTSVSSSDLTTQLKESVTFTATVGAVSPATVTPADGTVSFEDGGTPITGCATRATTGGVATCTTSILSVGDHSVTAVYSGGSSYDTSTSSAITQIVGPASTTSVVSQGTDTTVFGQTVTFTSTVSAVAPATATPTGTVSFSVNGTPITICTAKALNGSGVATCSTTGVPVSAASITTDYSGSTNSLTSTAPAIVHTVGKAATTTTLTSDVNPSVFSTSVTFTAVVATTAPGAGVANGSVAFKVAGVDITGCGTKTLDGSAIATCTTSALPVGTNPITAVYATTTNFAASTSAPRVQTVPKSATTTLVSSSDVTTAWNDPVTFTATIAPVSPATAVPTGGTLAFRIGGTAIAGCATRPVVTGVATCTTSSDPVGSLSVAAMFSGDVSYATSTSPSITQTVTKAMTATALASDQNPSRSGQAVTLTATVTSTAGVAEGTVSFFQVQKDSSHKLLAVGTLAAGVASITSDAMPVRIGSVVAAYNGDRRFHGSTMTIAQTVSRSYSNTLITSSQKRATAGDVVTFRVVVASDGDGAGTPAGLVSLYRVRANGSRAWIGRGNLRDTGITLITVTARPQGSWRIIAEYRGSTEHRDSHRSMTQVVGP